eukprot:CAMPEP_0204070902 /NCGR_PEP_ID=MMETSP0360-20130528/159229_1 /ASSEMBLY_ACC=CAM_ASM_000342 /TAXON_ID=268821 /ORGANISM="Scrippsiella Hangoei, Strain SHTV-5" /LENGTH=40 /DNA_ID= /DNA_START= /DNA_END= /DNA_ORIENTATION=
MAASIACVAAKNLTEFSTWSIQYCGCDISSVASRPKSVEK